MALAETINDMSEYKIKHLYLENNGLDDECFPAFLEKLRFRTELRSFSFVNNDLG